MLEHMSDNERDQRLFDPRNFLISKDEKRHFPEKFMKLATT